MRAALILLVSALATMTALPPALAQGFQVRPLSVEGEVPPGVTVDIPIAITGTSRIEGRTLEVSVVQLTQAADGAFSVVPYEEGGEVLPRSAAPWITAPSEVRVEAGDESILETEMRVPASARGTHVAGLLLTAPPPEDAEGLRLTIRILVPIIVGTEGRPARQEVRLADAALSYRLPEVIESADRPDPEDPMPETTIVDARVENRGGTYSRFSGDIWVDFKDDGDEWRQIRRVAIDETRLLPETSVNVPVDLGRLLPTGEYRIRGELYVDGRRTAPLRREIAFEGHPAVEDLVTDIDVGFTPAVFEYAYQPGARRTGVVTVENPSIDPIDVSVEVGLPSGMAGRAMGDVRGEDLSAVSWIEVAPPRFTLRPGQTRNLRLLARLPDTPPAYQNYYAELRLDARYADGQRAGAATAVVEVTRTDRPDNEQAEIASIMVSRLDGEDGYALALRAVNTGDVLLRPTVSYALIDEAGEERAGGTLSSEDTAFLMPLAARSFGGRLDLAGLKEGSYILLMTLEGGSGEIGAATRRISYSAEDGISVATPR